MYFGRYRLYLIQTAVMCPHYKLEWFTKRNYNEQEIKQIRVLVGAAFDYVSSTWVLENSDKLHANDAKEIQTDTVSCFFNSCRLYATHFSGIQ